MLGNNSLSKSNGEAAGRNGAAAPEAAPPEVHEGSDEEISLQEIVGVLFKNKWLILGCFAAVLLAASLYTFVKAPEYEASSTVLINDQSATPQLGQMIGLQAGQNNVANEVEILRSRTIAGRVAEELMDQQHAPGTQEMLSVLKTGPEQPLTKRVVMERLMGDRYVNITPVGPEVDLVRIQATSTIPAEASLMADLYAAEYSSYDRVSSSRRARKSKEFLSEAIKDFEDNLRQQEGDLQTFLTEQQVVAPDEEAKQLLEQVSLLQQRRFEAELKRGEAQTRLRRLRARLDSIQPGLAEEVTENDQLKYEALQQQIVKLQTRLEGLYAANPDLRSGTESSEEVEELQQKIAALRKQVRVRAEKLSQAAFAGMGVGVGSEEGGKLQLVQELSQRVLQSRIDLQSAQASLDVIDRELNTYRSKLEEIPQNEIVLSRLERSLRTSTEVYADLQKKLYDARIAEQSELGKVEIVDEALVPKEESPVRPNVPLNLVLGAVLGLMMGVGTAFLRTALDNKVRSPEGLRKAGHSVLGTVPDMQAVVESDFGGREYVDADGHRYSTRLISLLNPLSPIAETYRHLRTNLQFSRPDGRLRSVMVTSAGPGEGKSVTAANLAVTMAQAGRRTLYLDADLRRPSSHKTFGVAREPGLVDLLFDTCPGGLDRFITDIENLHVVPTGSSVPNPAEVVGSEKMEALMERLHRDFDAVVVDTPPVLAVTDPLLMAEQCDAVLLVCSANETEQQAVERATETLRQVGTQPVGAVLNRFDPKAAYGGYGYGYGYGYGKYYDQQAGDSSAEPAARHA